MHVEWMCKLSYTAPTRRPRLSIRTLATNPDLRSVAEPNGNESLSPSARALFALISLAAEAGEACPSNRKLAGVLGFSSVGHVPAVLNRIQAAGLIRIERGATARIVTILANGKRTAGELGNLHWRYRPENKVRRHVKYGEGRPRRGAERDAARGALPSRIDRDPCFYCGVRADVGCRHRRWRE